MTEGDELTQALDAALARSLTPPQPPSHLQVRLQAAMAQAADPRIAQLHGLLEREYRQQQAELDARYVRLRRRSFALVVGGAFAAGAVAAAWLPWLTAHLGAAAPLMVACAGAFVGLAIGISFWVSSRRDSSLQA